MINALRGFHHGRQQARSVAERLRAKGEAFRFTDQGQSWPVTLSVGVAALRAHAPATASALPQLPIRSSAPPRAPGATALRVLQAEPPPIGKQYLLLSLLNRIDAAKRR